MSHFLDLYLHPARLIISARGSRRPGNAVSAAGAVHNFCIVERAAVPEALPFPRRRTPPLPRDPLVGPGDDGASIRPRNDRRVGPVPGLVSQPEPCLSMLGSRCPGVLVRSGPPRVPSGRSFQFFSDGRARFQPRGGAFSSFCGSMSCGGLRLLAALCC